MKHNPCGMTKEYKGFRIIYIQKYGLYEIFDNKKYLAAKPTFQMTRDYIDELVGTPMKKNPKSRKFDIDGFTDEESTVPSIESDFDLGAEQDPFYWMPIYSKRRRNPVRKSKAKLPKELFAMIHEESKAPNQYRTLHDKLINYMSSHLLYNEKPRFYKKEMEQVTKAIVSIMQDEMRHYEILKKIEKRLK